MTGTLTSSVEDNRRTWLTERVAVITQHPEVILGTARRRLPLVPRTIGADTVRQVDPLAHGPVLDHVSLYGSV